jgi:DNA polymerase III sliding clamp (beta) subunit (PCNA family)
MQFANNQAKFTFGGMEFVTKLVEGKFPTTTASSRATTPTA